MANRSTVQIKPNQSQLKGLYAAFRNMDDDSKTKLKNDVSLISAWSAGELRQGAYSAPMSSQSIRVADTVRPNKDRIPNVTIGGSKSRFSGGAVSGQILFGNEFGANPNGANGSFPNGGRRFPFRSPSKGRGNEGYWIFKTLTAIQPDITHRWKNAVTDVLNNWKKGSGGGVV
jgi:hypothetical protein